MSSKSYEFGSSLFYHEIEQLTTNIPGIFNRKGNSIGGFNIDRAAPVLAECLQRMKLPDMEYDGTFGDVVANIDGSIESGSDPLLMLSAGRLVRSVIDTKIIDMKINPRSTTQTFDAVHAATKFALDVARGTGTRDSLNDLMSLYPAINLAPATSVSQKQDVATLSATQPDRIVQAAAKLDTVAGGEDVLFLSICHGGFMAGVGTYLTREHNRQTGNSLFYPVRFSRAKHKDQEPRLTPDERERLRQEVTGRKAVLFDEDVCSGSTMTRAQDYFYNLFGEGVHYVTTYDMHHDIGNMMLGSGLKVANQISQNSTIYSGDVDASNPTMSSKQQTNTKIIETLLRNTVNLQSQKTYHPENSPLLRIIQQQNFDFLELKDLDLIYPKHQTYQENESYYIH